MNTTRTPDIVRHTDLMIDGAYAANMQVATQNTNRNEFGRGVLASSTPAS